MMIFLIFLILILIALLLIIIDGSVGFGMPQDREVGMIRANTIYQ